MKTYKNCFVGKKAVDFLVEDEDMLEVVEWVANNLAFDRMYFYGSNRPIHISYSGSLNREIYELTTTKNGNQVPKKLTFPLTNILLFRVPVTQLAEKLESVQRR